jgi:alpha-1,2-mannosyltransferase
MTTGSPGGGTVPVRSTRDPGAARGGPPARDRGRLALMACLGLASVAAVLVPVGRLALFHRSLDFSVYMMGAHHLVDGRLYTASLPTAPHLPFTYPPFAALILAPLAVLPFTLAQVLWALASSAALFAVIAVTLRCVRPETDRLQVVLWSLVLMAPAYWIEPVRLTFSFGQVNLVLAALILADLTRRIGIGGRTLPRGVLIGIAAAVKLVPLVFVPYLFVTGQRRAAWVSLGSFVACSMVATAVDPRVSWSYWTKYSTDAQRVGGVFYISNQSLRAAADRLDHRVVSVALVTAASAVVLVMGIALARWAHEASSPFLGLLVCATTGLLVSPITWAHHLVWAVPVLMWLALGSDRPAGGRIWAAAGAALFWWAPIWDVPNGANQELGEHGWQLLGGNAFVAAMVLFLVGIAAMLALRRARARAEPVEAPAVATTLTGPVA